MREGKKTEERVVLPSLSLFRVYPQKNGIFLIFFFEKFQKALFNFVFLLYNRLRIRVFIPSLFAYLSDGRKDYGEHMKQKYTITVADMELSIISDAAPDEVENIVGILDRRIRDIKLRSPRCTKNEAAILCALSYCSERIAMQEAFKKVEKDAFRYAGENEKLKKTIEEMQEELDTIRKDAAVMRSILDRAAISAVVDTTAAAEKSNYTPKPVSKTVDEPISNAKQLSVFDTPASEEEAPAAKKAQKQSNKSRVGNMFDLLTFSDI